MASSCLAIGLTCYRGAEAPNPEKCSRGCLGKCRPEVGCSGGCLAACLAGCLGGCFRACSGSCSFSFLSTKNRSLAPCQALSRAPHVGPALPQAQKAADVWEKDVWEFQAKSGSSGSCCPFLHFLGKIAVQEMSGRTPGSPRHSSCRHPRPSDKQPPHFSGFGGSAPL